MGAAHAESCSSGILQRNLRCDVAPNIGGGGPGCSRSVPRAGVSPRRPLSPAADTREQPGPAAEPARDGGPGAPARSHRGGADGTVARRGHGPGVRGLGHGGSLTLTPIFLLQGRGERAYDIYSRLLRERIVCVMGPVSAPCADPPLRLPRPPAPLPLTRP